MQLYTRKYTEIAQATAWIETDRYRYMYVYIHAGDAVFLIAGDVEPGARAYEVRIPALEHLIRIGQAPAKREERVSIGIPTRRRHWRNDG